MLFSLLYTVSTDPLDPMESPLSPVRISASSHSLLNASPSSLAQLWLNTFSSVSLHLTLASLPIHITITEDASQHPLHVALTLKTAEVDGSANLLSQTLQQLKLHSSLRLLLDDSEMLLSLSYVHSKSLTLHSSPLSLSLTPSSVNLLLHLASFLHLLPASRPSLLVPKLILFANHNKRQQLLREELQKVRPPNCACFLEV